MPQLHARGVEIMVDLMDAADHLDALSREEIQTLMRETAVILGELLKRDVPADRHEQ